MRAKLRAERLLESLQSSVNNLISTLGRTSAFSLVENNLEKIDDLIEQLQELIDVEDGSMDNNY